MLSVGIHVVAPIGRNCLRSRYAASRGLRLADVRIDGQVLAFDVTREA